MTVWSRRIKWANSLIGRRIHFPGTGTRTHVVSTFRVGSRSSRGIWIYADGSPSREWVCWPDIKKPKRDLRERKESVI